MSNSKTTKQMPRDLGFVTKDNSYQNIRVSQTDILE